MRPNAFEKEKRRFFAIASVGKDRWYWVVWPSLEEVRSSDEPLLHVGEGYEHTKVRAVEKALELAGRYAQWVAAKYARIYHRGKTVGGPGKPGSRPAGQTGMPSAHAFLYREVYDPEHEQWVSVPHRIVKRTNKYVFVDQQPYRPEQSTGSWLDREPATFRLDRQTLEQEGYAFVPANALIADSEQPVFYTYKRVKSPGSAHFDYLQALGLSWPCTEADVKGAYRRLVKDAHPDGGGSQEAFLALQEAYEQALDLCRGNLGEASPPQ